MGKNQKINKCQNPQWDKLIELPICNYSDFVEIELMAGGIFSDTKLGYYKIGIEELSNEPEKKDY